jgi:hypothetical protein
MKVDSTKIAKQMLKLCSRRIPVENPYKTEDLNKYLPLLYYKVSSTCNIRRIIALYDLHTLVIPLPLDEPAAAVPVSGMSELVPLACLLVAS